jgi:hypothetical protein
MAKFPLNQILFKHDGGDNIEIIHDIYHREWIAGEENSFHRILVWPPGNLLVKRVNVDGFTLNAHTLICGLHTMELWDVPTIVGTHTNASWYTATAIASEMRVKGWPFEEVVLAHKWLTNIHRDRESKEYLENDGDTDDDAYRFVLIHGGALCVYNESEDKTYLYHIGVEPVEWERTCFVYRGKNKYYALMECHKQG